MSHKEWLEVLPGDSQEVREQKQALAARMVQVSILGCFAAHWLPSWIVLSRMGCLARQFLVEVNMFLVGEDFP